MKDTSRSVSTAAEPSAGPRPLNPELVELADEAVSAQRAGRAATEPEPGGLRLLRVAFRTPWRASSAYAEGGDSVLLSQAFWVRSEGPHVPTDVWQACEFAALSVMSLRNARYAVWNPRLLSDLGREQTAFAAGLGLAALQSDYERVVALASSIRVPEAFGETYRAHQRLLRQGGDAWHGLRDACAEILRTGMEGGGVQRRERLATLEGRLRHDGISWSDVSVDLRNAERELWEQVLPLGISMAIDVGDGG